MAKPAVPFPLIFLGFLLARDSFKHFRSRPETVLSGEHLGIKWRVRRDYYTKKYYPQFWDPKPKKWTRIGRHFFPSADLAKTVVIAEIDVASEV